MSLYFARDAAGRHGEAGAFSPPGSRPPGMAGPAGRSLTQREKGTLPTRGIVNAAGQGPGGPDSTPSSRSRWRRKKGRAIQPSPLAMSQAQA